MNSEKVIKEIIDGKKNILVPIFDGLAYIDVEVTDKEQCLINLGDNYYIKTKLSKANEVVKRINLEKDKNDHSIRKLDENTFEIRENIAIHQEEEKKKDKNNEKDKNNDNSDKKNKEDEFKKKIMEENKMLLEKINQKINDRKNNSDTKRLKLKKKEDIIEIVLKKLNSN